MDAVQRMRKKAKDGGNLKSTDKQKVETKLAEDKQVIVVQQASPEVVYVPSYNPTVVYGAPAYPYPPIAYPPPGITRQGWRFRSVSVLRWEPPGAVVGVGTPEGGQQQRLR